MKRFARTASQKKGIPYVPDAVKQRNLSRTICAKIVHAKKLIIKGVIIMKKTISLLLATVLILLSIFTLISCDSGKESDSKIQYKTITLTKENIYDYVSVRTFHENFECQKRSDLIFGSKYDWSMLCNIKIKGKNSNYKFDNVNIKVNITTSPFSNSELNITLDDNGEYEDVFYCSGTEYIEPNSARIQVTDLIFEVSGSVKIPE
jgi:hypothetical protein